MRAQDMLNRPPSPDPSPRSGRGEALCPGLARNDATHPLSRTPRLQRTRG